MGSSVEETAELTLHGVAYTVHLSALGDASLALQVEQVEDATTWSAQFTAKYIEEITQRTHNFKSFPVFVRMLITALRQESDSVFVDLLTYSDLEMLKSQRAGARAAPAAVQQPPGSGLGPNNKRYLILTYAAEFDRVHYPLPLQQEEPDPQRLKALIRQLRLQLGTQQQRRPVGASRRQTSDPPSEVRALREENAALRQQLKQQQQQGEVRGMAGLGSDVQQLAAEAQETVKDLRQMRRERDALMLRAQQAEAALEGERNLHRRELRRKMKEQQDLSTELGAAKDQIHELRLKCRELTQELDLTQRRAKVANLSASYRERARQVGPRTAGRTEGPTPGGSRGTSPAGSRQSSRGASPAPARRVLQSAPQQQRSRSAGPERPSSVRRFDPTEYVRQIKDRQQAAADRLEEMRRMQRLQQLPSSRPGSRPASRPQSLPPSRPYSMPNSRHSTPVRSRVPSRDPSADRVRGCRDPRGGSRERTALASSTERLRGAVSTTYGILSKEQRATSPGRALLEVKARLSQFAGHSKTVASRCAAPASTASPQAPSLPQQQPAPTSDAYLDASTEIADIDARLQSLQQFLKAAKTGVPAKAPA